MQKAEPEVPQAPPYFNFAADVFDFWAQQRPGELALWCVKNPEGTEQRFSFAELARVSRQAANYFISLGVRPGDRVLVMLPRASQWWVSVLGLIRFGAIPVPATLLLTPRDLAFRFETARISAVITNREGLAKLDAFPGIKILAATAGPDPAPAGWHDFNHGVQHASDQFAPVKTRSDAPGVLFFTSATTGHPKMVLHSQASYGLGHRVTGKYCLDLKPGDVHWNISDLGWAKAAWSSFFGPWQMGACVFVVDNPGKFDPAFTLDVLEQFPVTTWCAPPTALRLIVRQSLNRRKFRALRHCVTAGEPLNPEVFNLWSNATGLALHEGYGQTETVVLVANFRSLGHSVQPGSMGTAAPGSQVALVDESLRPVSPGTEGEIAIRVKPSRPLGLFSGYWENPEEMAVKFRGDWYLTGDRAVRDKHGYFWFLGRNDDVIKSSGYRIGPFEVESALLEHPAVLDVAVVGKADPLRGQIVKACVVLRSGLEPADELKTELQAYCKGLIAAYKYPREIEFVAELPKTTSGKTRRAELRGTAAPL